MQFVITTADPVQPAHDENAAVPQIVFRFAPLFPLVRGHVVAAHALVNENILVLHAVGSRVVVLARGGLPVRGGNPAIVEFAHNSDGSLGYMDQL
ncbi:hypothetical protein BVI434_1860028 [Burkholderia vietnamiensis]|nr:hypothetical protein BVI434_1860028 [Burkholderia vietnamiensis]